MAGLFGFMSHDDEVEKQQEHREAMSEEERIGRQREADMWKLREETNNWGPLLEEEAAELDPKRGAFADEEIVEARPTTTKNIQTTSIDKRSTRAIQEQEKKVLATQQQLLQQEADNQVRASQAQQPIIDKANAEMNRLNEQKMARQEAFNRELQNDLRQLELSRERLAKMQPKSFWANKDTEDKLMIGLATVFGGLGSGLAGKKSNAGIDALNRVVERDMEAKKNFFNNQLKLLDRKKIGIQEKAQLQSKIMLEYDAHKAHSKELLRQKLEKIAATAKNDTIKNQAAQQAQALERELLQQHRDTEAKLANRVTEKMTLVLDAETGKPIAQAQRDGDMTQEEAYAMLTSRATGEVKPLNELQGKSNAFLQRIEKHAKLAEEIESTLTEDELADIRELVAENRALQDLKDISVVGNQVSSFENITSLDEENKWEDIMPGKGGRYYRALQFIAFHQARFVSGAKIDANDVKNELLHMMPSVTTTMDDLSSEHGPTANRRALLKAHQAVAGGRRKPLYFQKVKKRKRKTK